MILKLVLDCAEEGEVKSIALPAIGTGTLGYPIKVFVRALDFALCYYKQ
jgi:O-acetyl-ADP-ribose deacetylase (regulator of RNase III)